MGTALAWAVDTSLEGIVNLLPARSRCAGNRRHRPNGAWGNPACSWHDPGSGQDGMGTELVLALVIPLALLLLGTVLLERHQDRLPIWLERLSQHRGWIWNAGIGLIIGLSLLRFLLGR